MMKINLLGQGSPELKAATGSSVAARQAIVFIVSLVISMSTVAFVYYYWSHQTKQELAALTREQIRKKELATVRAQNQEYQRQLKTLEERVQTIQKLQTKRQGPVDLMEGLDATVNKTRNLYLLQMTPEGKLLHIRGEAERVQSIAQFINALMNSPRFGDVKLKQYYQDDQHGRTNFKFNLDCSYNQPQTAGPEGHKKTTMASLSENGK